MNYSCDIINYDTKGVIILFVFSLVMFFPNTINALCKYDKKNELQALATNLGFSYNYTETDEGINSKVNFSITITNMKPELYIVDQTNVNAYYYSGEEITINNFTPGSTIQFIVYGNEGDCDGVELINNYVTLPSYNRFYKDEICSGIGNYKLCNRWAKVDMSYNAFIKKVTEYKEKIIQEQPPTELEKNIIEIILEFLSKYSFYVFGFIIIVCSGLIFYLRRKDDFDLG